MLENAIARLYRKIRDARRERRAERYDEIAWTCDVVAETYRTSLLLLDGFHANMAAKLMARRGAEKYEASAREARQKAAAIRAGRRA